MTSARKFKKNRANAQASTGPKTMQGKARAAQNARRHGLSLSVFIDPALSAEVENLAHEIAGEGASSDVVECARCFSEAQIDLVRVRQTRYELLARYLNDSEYRPKNYFRADDTIKKTGHDDLRRCGPFLPPGVVQQADDAYYWKPQGVTTFAYNLSDLTTQLIKLHRYERRALSRRKFAIRALDAVRSEART